MNALEIFYEICAIAHPSGATGELRDFIIDFVRKFGCEVKLDRAQNIHIFKGAPKYCFQAHYDMVLIGKNIVPHEINGELRAQDSSLGADNGAALACILALAQTSKNLEALITNDEEIGMIGANNCELKIASRAIINLDSEDINEIIVGCAGGFDANIALKRAESSHNCQNNNAHFYELKARGFRGGHSGIDINKNIKNAIIELLWRIHEIPCEVLSIRGGEKRNSIPVCASAIIASELKIAQDSQNAAFERIEIHEIEPFKYDSIIPKSELEKLLKIHSGVYEMRDSSVISSLNLSMIDDEGAKIMVRANSHEFLERHKARLKMICENVAFSGFYAPWEREDSEVLGEIEKIYQAQKISYQIKEIHAGLECGILKEKCGAREVISIGPTIKNPHSKNESLNLESFRQFCEIVAQLNS